RGGAGPEQPFCSGLLSCYPAGARPAHLHLRGWRNTDPDADSYGYRYCNSHGHGYSDSYGDGYSYSNGYCDSYSSTQGDTFAETPWDSATAAIADQGNNFCRGSCQ